MGQIIRLTSTLTRASSVTQYTAGDLVTDAGPSLFTFTLPNGVSPQGRILACSLVVVPASGNLVITALDGTVYVWKSADALAAVADNAAYSVTGAYMNKVEGYFNFVNTAWRNPLGALTASTDGWQHMTPVNHGVSGAPFSFKDGDALAIDANRTFSAAMQVTGAWNPGAVAQAITMHLDLELTRD